MILTRKLIILSFIIGILSFVFLNCAGPFSAASDTDNQPASSELGTISVRMVIPDYYQLHQELSTARTIGAKIISPATAYLALTLDELSIPAQAVTSEYAPGTPNAPVEMQSSFTVAVGTYETVRIELLDASMNALTQGYASNVTVQSGQITDIAVTTFPTESNLTSLAVNGGEISGFVSAGDMDYLSFGAMEGIDYEIHTTSASSIDLYIFGPDGLPTGSVADQDYFFGPGSFTHPAMRSGTHYIGVYGLLEDANYTIEIVVPGGTPRLIDFNDSQNPGGCATLSNDLCWKDDGNGEGHLYCDYYSTDDFILFDQPVHVISFMMNMMPWEGFTIANEPIEVPVSVHDSSDAVLWSSVVDLSGTAEWSSWVTVNIDTANVSYIKLGAPGHILFPSVDNLLIME